MSNLSGHGQLTGSMRGGAGGGTYVEANPEGEATDTLEKLMVESDIFEIRNVPGTTGAELGSVLTRTANGAEWSPLAKELPTYIAADNGKILKIVNGSPAWDYPINYSTDEHVVGVWIDGKLLYGKVINLGNMPAQGSEVTYPLNITNLNQIIKYEVFCNNGTQTRFIPNVSRGNISAQTLIYATATHLGIVSGSSSDIDSNFVGYAIVQYTKVGE